MRTDRQEFSRQTKEERWRHADGKCEYCHQDFAGRRPDYHHHTPAALGGGNDFSNCRCICPPCHRRVTRDEDVPRISKAKRSEADRAGLRPRRSSFREKRDYFRKLLHKEEHDYDT
jgi:5-methylcytosine-specific restriction endonuclease McrA